MSIRLKLVIIFSLLIIAATLPLSLFTLRIQENSRLADLKKQGTDLSMHVARLSAYLIVSSGGDLQSAEIDSRELIGGGLLSDTPGLIGAEARIASTGRKIFNFPPSVTLPMLKTMTDSAMIGAITINEGTLADRTEVYEFVSSGKFKGRNICTSRVILSKAYVRAPIKKMRFIALVAVACSVFVMSVVALLLSRFISRPIYDLIDEVSILESGNFNIQMKVNSRDEIGRLATTIYHLAQMIEIEFRELRRANEELRRLDQLKDEFLANMSHELRSPLHGMIGIAESILAGASGEITHDAEKDLSLIVTSGMRLSNLINDILDFSRLTHHDIQIRKETVDLFSIADHVLAILRPLIAKKSISAENRITPANTNVVGDENRLVQILMNLVGNAVKFTDSGNISISAQRKDNMIELTVEDTGIGIPADRIDRIFESFEQGDGSAARQYGGTGLGLAVTKRLVALHSGEIRVESQINRGSRFIVSLPASDFTAPSSNLPPPLVRVDEAILKRTELQEKRATGSKGTILAVDDDPVNLQILVNNLSLASYRVITAPGGQEALDVIGKMTVDLVILDVMMPKMSGYDVCRRIREHYTASELPVIMLSAKGRTEEIVAGIEAGANDYLVKPVLREELLARSGSLITIRNSLAERDQLTSLKREIHIAQRIQEDILGRDLPEVRGISAGVYYLPSYEIGGDFYDLIPLSDGKLGAVIADVSGHGIPAALLCSMLKIGCSFSSSTSTGSADFIATLNSILSPHMRGMYITACYAIFDPHEAKMRFANAGHWPPVLIRDSAVSFLGEGRNGYPLGWVDEGYLETEVRICEGDRLILFTDCLVEAQRAPHDMFGDARFKQLVRDTRHLTAQVAAREIVGFIRDWASPAKGHLADDATIIVIDIIQAETDEAESNTL